jgi:hypothetical protein
MRPTRFRFTLKECRGVRAAIGTIREIVDEVEGAEHKGKEESKHLLAKRSRATEAHKGEKEGSDSKQNPSQGK